MQCICSSGFKMMGYIGPGHCLSVSDTRSPGQTKYYFLYRFRYYFQTQGVAQHKGIIYNWFEYKIPFYMKNHLIITMGAHCRFFVVSKQGTCHGYVQ